MTSFLDPLIAFVSAHAWLGYLTLFLAALLEAVPVLGAVIPGSTVILALSALVPGGELRLEGVLAAAILGALIGDGSAFWLGHNRQRAILTAWPLSGKTSQSPGPGWHAAGSTGSGGSPIQKRTRWVTPLLVSVPRTSRQSAPPAACSGRPCL